MSVNSVNNAASGSNSASTAYQSSAAAKKVENGADTQATAKTDGFVKQSYSSDVKMHEFKSKSVLTKENAETIERLQLQAEQGMKKLIDSVRTQIEKQSNRFSELSDVLNLKYADPKTIEDAKASLQGDGEYSVKTVSNNILGLAKALANGDSSNYSTLRDAFKKGFEQAEKAFGGKLADISYDTYDAVMKGFDKLEGKKTDETKDNTTDKKTAEE